MAEGIVSSILGWLRAGYPDGVPTSDYFPLIALLRRSLSDEQLDAVVDDLESRQAAPADDADIRDAIRAVTDTPPDEADVRVVAARLASAGWPLVAGTALTPPAEPAPGLVERAIAWVRRGYPEGVPASDYVPLFALLRRRLADDEVRSVAESLVAEHAGESGTISRVDAQVLITKVLGELPSPEDLARVESRLNDDGWVLG